MHYKTNLFYGWRLATTFIKKRKMNIKVRVWANLVKNRIHNRVDQHTVQLFLHFDNSRRKKLLSKVLDAMRIDHKKVKFKSSTEVLSEDVHKVIKTT